ASPPLPTRRSSDLPYRHTLGLPRMRRKGIRVEVWSRTRNRHGDYESTLKGTLTQCVFVPRISQELDQIGVVTENAGALNRIEARSEATVFTRDYSVPVTADDFLVMPNGDRWEVSGEPRVWEAVFSDWKPGVEITCSRKAA